MQFTFVLKQLLTEVHILLATQLFLVPLIERSVIIVWYHNYLIKRRDYKSREGTFTTFMKNGSIYILKGLEDTFIITLKHAFMYRLETGLWVPTARGLRLNLLHVAVIKGIY